MRAAGVPMFSPVQDSSRYFDIHHTADDTLDKIDREELNTGVATIAALLYTLAETETPPERIPEAERERPRTLRSPAAERYNSGVRMPFSAGTRLGPYEILVAPRRGRDGRRFRRRRTRDSREWSR